MTMKSGGQMENKLFNSLFEMQLRILLLLSVAPPEPITSDMIVAVDFITIYGQEFHISNESLHGNNRFKYSAIANRRLLVQESLRELVLDGLICVNLKNGYRYSITAPGRDYAQSLCSTYAEKYRKTAEVAFEYCEDKSEKDLLREFQQRSVAITQEDS